MSYQVDSGVARVYSTVINRTISDRIIPKLLALIKRVALVKGSVNMHE